MLGSDSNTDQIGMQGLNNGLSKRYAMDDLPI